MLVIALLLYKLSLSLFQLPSTITLFVISQKAVSLAVHSFVTVDYRDGTHENG